MRKENYYATPNSPAPQRKAVGGRREDKSKKIKERGLTLAGVSFLYPASLNMRAPMK